MTLIKSFAMAIVFLFAFARGSAFSAPLESEATMQDPPLSYYKVIEQRNFFRPQLSAQEKKTDSSVAAVRAHPLSSDEYAAAGFILTGIVKIRGSYKAIIEKQDETKGYYVKIGDMMEDYVVVDIRADEAVLQKEDQIFTLKIEGAQPGAPGDAAGAVSETAEPTTPQPDETPLKNTALPA
jgi:hypothetical protein